MRSAALHRPRPRCPIRSRHGRRYPLAFLLTCLVAALLCNCNSLEAVGEWCAEHQDRLSELFGAQRHLSPTGSLFRWLLPRLSAHHLEWALSSWVQATLVAPVADPLALDGKSLRGAALAEQPAPHLLACCTHQSHETVLQVPVASHTNEIPVAQALVPHLLLGRLDEFASKVHTGLADADWQLRREIIRGLVKQLEVTSQQVTVVFRIGPQPAGPGPPGDPLQHCPCRLSTPRARVRLSCYRLTAYVEYI